VEVVVRLFQEWSAGFDRGVQHVAQRDALLAQFDVAAGDP
jgi:hypothetical protein